MSDISLMNFNMKVYTYFLWITHIIKNQSQIQILRNTFIKENDLSPELESTT